MNAKYPAPVSMLFANQSIDVEIMMRASKPIAGSIIALALQAMATATFACDLKVESAWIREAPPNAMAMAGYAKLSNASSAVLKLQSITSKAFASVDAHESFTENGIAKMRPAVVEIPAKGTLEFTEGGKHFMLMGPKQALKKGDVVTLNMTDSTGCTTAVPFKVGAAASLTMDHSTMDHSKMDHAKMD